MPTSVLLAILAAAGLLALAPALVRRHDAVERQVAERAQSTARILSRSRRRRSVPGRRPVNPSRALLPTLRTAAPAGGGARGGSSDGPGPAGRAGSGLPRDSADRNHGVDGSGDAGGGARAGGRGRAGGRDGVAGRTGEGNRERAAAGAWGRRRTHRPAGPRQERGSHAVHRRRRVLAALLLLNVVKLAAVVVVGPGFWVGFAVTATLLVVYLVHLRGMAVADRQRRRIEARRAAALAAQQAQVRLAQQRRALARRESARRMAEQRESLRRAAASGSAAPTVLYRAVPPRRSRAGGLY